VLIVFTSIAILIFGDLNDSMIVNGTTRQSQGYVNFESFTDVMIMYFESALGSFNIGQYKGGRLGIIGVYYHILFLTINLILLLNYVIAILSSTFAAFEDKSNGLYYEVVIKQFSRFLYDNEYGYIAAGTPPMNIVAFGFFII